MKKEDVYDTRYTVECPLPFLWPYHTKRLIKKKIENVKKTPIAESVIYKIFLLKMNLKTLQRRIFLRISTSVMEKNVQAILPVICSMKKKLFHLGLSLKKIRKLKNVQI